MKRFHPVIAVILGNIATSFIGSFIRYLPEIPLLNILGILILIFGGFTATYLSRTNKAIIGFYSGLLYSIGSLMGIIFISKTGLTFNSVLILALVFPISGLIGGFIGKILRSRLDNGKKKKIDNRKTKNNGYMVCNKCNGHYELQSDELPEDFTECECGGKFEYHIVYD